MITIVSFIVVLWLHCFWHFFLAVVVVVVVVVVKVFVSKVVELIHIQIDAIDKIS